MSNSGAHSSPRVRRKQARRRQILDLALQIAEAEGWEAVTTRRLADGIDFSQPVIYQHFAGRDDVIRALTLEGFTALEHRVRALRPAEREPAHLAPVCRTYLDFAREHPRLYDAMFTRPTSLPFADEQTPPELAGAFDALAAHIAHWSPGVEPGPAAELLWACCHGLATLQGSGRIPADRLEQHIYSIEQMVTNTTPEASDR